MLAIKKIDRFIIEKSTKCWWIIVHVQYITFNSHLYTTKWNYIGRAKPATWYSHWNSKILVSRWSIFQRVSLECNKKLRLHLFFILTLFYLFIFALIRLEEILICQSLFADAVAVYKKTRFNYNFYKKINCYKFIDEKIIWQIKNMINCL